jgi:hypothetical protein
MQSYEPVINAGARLRAAHVVDDLIIEVTDEGTSCREATVEESQAFAGHDQVVPLHIISTLRPEGINPLDTGLSIILRSTQQLENFPQAKAAFLKAAESWEAVIRTPITIIIDVDFGPTRFGIPYPSPTILGSANAQLISASDIYTDVRSGLIAKASSAQESVLYNALPVGVIPTDMGSTTEVLAASSVYRALGIIGPVANPASETALGPPPSIGFNSAFQFDFDPSNGVDPNKVDFDSVAVHEIGHVLGFGSNVGNKELRPDTPLSTSMLDLFRFRPGVTLGTFSTSQRIQSSGGTQVFFGGGLQLGLSTGRPDITGGDGRQASHWKDDALTGQHIGIMDPTLPNGVRETITDNDLFALNIIGYQIGAAEDETVPLTSGISQPGSVTAPDEGEAVLSVTQYTVQVPVGSSQLTVDLNGNQDVDLHVRFGQRVSLGTSGPVADHVSNSPSGVESITITTASSPTLRAGTYFIAVANFGPGSAGFNVKATVAGGGGGGGGDNAPVINSLQAELNGDVITLTGVAADLDGDIIQAQSKLLDGSRQVVGQTAPFSVNFGTATTVNFTLTVSNLNSLPSAMLASLILIDRQGNQSAARIADFSQRAAGGPTVSNVSYNGSKLIIKGNGFANQVSIEINGQVVSIGPSASGKKIKVKRNPVQLNLRAGPNRLRVSNGNLQSNLFVLNR